MRWVLGLGVPIIAVVLWALFVAPEATVEAPAAVRIAIEVAILGGAALALVATGHPALGIAYALVVVANRIRKERALRRSGLHPDPTEGPSARPRAVQRQQALSVP